MDVLHSLLTPPYLSVLISFIVLIVTFLHLYLCSRTSSLAQFQTIRVVWFVLVFLAGSVAIGLLYDSRLLAAESGHGRLAFMLLSFWFGLICSAYAAFGIFAWTLPSRWNRIIELREQRRAAKTTVGGRL
jgi:hypothetical protein